METGYCALGHDSPSGQYWYQSLQEIDDVLPRLWMIQWCHWPGLMLQPGFDWHATRNWWPADGMGSRSDKMSPGHGTPVTKLLPRSWHEGAPCLTFSAETRMGASGLLTVCGKSVVSIPDLHRILGKTGTNQQSNTNDINITDKWIQ